MQRIKKFDVIGLGSLAVDFIGGIEEWPTPGTKNGLTDFNIYDGGLTGTALTTVARLGGRAAYIGKAGESEMAVRAINALKSEGIDLSMVIKDPASEPIIAIVFTSSDDKERNVFFQKSNLRFPFPEEIPDKNWSKKTKVFITDHVAGDAGVYAAKKAISEGVDVVVDIERLQDNVTGLLENASHIIVGEKFARGYSGSDSFGDQVRSLRKKDYQVVIVTLGENGCNCTVDGGNIRIPGFKVQVVDTTGCGDVFHGAYSYCIARGEKPYEACVVANAAAALKARFMGGRTGIPARGKLEEFLTNFNYERLFCN